jgi:8-oxo-dGTP pyrophosphatase MutT (NUDIX family)
MPLSKKSEHHAYRFTDDITFFQKAVIIHPKGEKFLIIKRSIKDAFRPDTWDLPGGNILYGEVHAEGLRREILEEVDLKISHLNPVHMITHFTKSIPMYYIVVGFRCKALTDLVKLSHEHSEFQWISKDAFLKMDPKYQFREERIFDQNSTDFLRDIVYSALQK